MSLTRLLAVAAVSAVVLTGCQSNPASKAPAAKAESKPNVATSADNWCERYPQSAVCGGAETRTASNSSWCDLHPQSAVCPEGIAKAEQKQTWCAEYPASAICK